MESDRPCGARIDLGALQHNFEIARTCADNREIYAVVKADAYGHGAVRTADALAAAGCERFAVLSAREGVELREAGLGQSILVMGGVATPAEAEAVIAASLTPVVHGPDCVDLLGARARAAGRRLACHIEVDTGMRRMGVPVPEAVALFARVAEDDALELEGAFTHFACADDPDTLPSAVQAEIFRDVLRAAANLGLRPAEVHADNSAALLAGGGIARALPEATAVRPGLMLYGVNPAPHLVRGHDLRPAMTLEAGIIALRSVREGDTVGYGGAHRFEGDGRVATLAAGYEDGIPVSLSNRGLVEIGGRRHRMVGRVSMDSVGVDLADAPAALGDRAVVFGQSESGAAEMRVEAQAERAGTLSYELLVRVGRRVPREYHGG